MPFRKIYKISTTSIGYIARAVRFMAIVAVFYIIYKLLLEQVLDGSKELIPALLLWILSAYIVLPRIHRLLSKYYLPNYFVGRVRSPSGLLSDPVNLAFISKETSIHSAMIKAGWTQAESLNIKTLFQVIIASFLHRSYLAAPVGDMILFNRKQDFAYEIEVDGSPNQRHHIRFWQTPDNWHLPGGHKADWLAAASYDTHVGLKIATGQIDHFIHEDIDKERDFVVRKLKATGLTKSIEIVKHFTDAYHDKNNGGDQIKTDGSLPFIFL